MKKVMTIALSLALCLSLSAFAGENCAKSGSKSACSASKTTATQASATEKASCGSTGATTASATSADKHCDKNAATCNMQGKLTAGHCDPSFCTPDDCAKWTKACETYGANAEIRMMSVKGMTCAGCEGSVTTALKATPGVFEVAKVDHKAGVAIVIVDKTVVKNDVLATTVTNKGYEAQIMPAVATTTTDAGAQKVDAKKAGCAATCTTPCDKGKAAEKTGDNSTSKPH